MRSQLVRHFDATTYPVYTRLNLSAAVTFGTSSYASKKAMPPRPTLPNSDLHHVYLKGSGPGGQKINKTNSACQLTHVPTGIVVKSQATRSRSQNHNIARRILAEKIELLEKGEDSRVAIKTAAASKKKASKRKKALRKYRKLREDKASGENDEDEDERDEEVGALDGAEDDTMNQPDSTNVRAADSAISEHAGKNRMDSRIESAKTR